MRLLLQLLNLLEVVMVNADNDSDQSGKSEASPDKPSGSESTMQDAHDNANAAGSSAAIDHETKPEAANSGESSLRAVLLSLPQAELRLLCSLLAREGYVPSIFVKCLGTG